jgi:DNA-binding NarL/FixJ family response regulator
LHIHDDEDTQELVGDGLVGSQMLIGASEDIVNLGVASALVLTRRMLCAWLAKIKGFRVVLEVDSTFDSLDQIRKTRPDVLIIDTLNPPSDLEIVAKVSKLLPHTKILLLSEMDEERFELEAIRAGAHGSVSKRSDPKVLEKALRVVAQGEIWMSHRVASNIISEFRRWRQPVEEKSSGQLTKREEAILTLLANGYRNKEIASRLSISENTIKTHLNTIYRKLQVSTRVEAALRYFEQAKHRSKLSGRPSPSALGKHGELDEHHRKAPQRARVAKAGTRPGAE